MREPASAPRPADPGSGLRRETGVLFVDDGSTDATLQTLRELDRDDTGWRLVLFAQFRQEIAIAAGMDAARGRGAVIMAPIFSIRRRRSRISSRMARGLSG